MAEIGPQFPDLAEFITRVVRRAGGHGGRLAELAGFTRGVAAISEAKSGNPRWGTLEKLAKGAGFRNAVAMFASGGDAKTAEMLRLWKALPDDAARNDLLVLARESFFGPEGSGARVDEAPRRGQKGR